MTHLSLVATQLYRLLRDERGRAALRGLKAVLLGGGPAPAALIEEAVAGRRARSSRATARRRCPRRRPRRGPATRRRRCAPPAGRSPFRELAIAADGEILVRGRTLFRGYVEGGGVRPARDAAGWFHTGDLGRLDADGRLVVTGRRDTMFISGGENIHPEEIEREILRFPGVLEAIVVPVPDPEFGARPVAFLRTADGQPARRRGPRPLPAADAAGLQGAGALPGLAGARGGDEARPARARGAGRPAAGRAAPGSG